MRTEDQIKIQIEALCNMSLEPELAAYSAASLVIFYWVLGYSMDDSIEMSKQYNKSSNGKIKFSNESKRRKLNAK